MKKVIKNIIAGGLCLSIVSCTKTFVDLEPTGQFTDAVYFTKPADFKSYATGLYGQLPGWSFGNMDNSSDLSANGNTNGYDLGHGTIAVGSTSWNYNGIRSCNILLSKAATYSGSGDISQYVA